MNICHSPSNSAAPKPAKANHRCARTSRLLFHTAQPPPLRRHASERGLVDDFDPAPHALMAHAAELVAGHSPLAWCVETSPEAGNIARHQHKIDVRPVDQETVHHI